jgi:hypothetical protein
MATRKLSEILLPAYRNIGIKNLSINLRMKNGMMITKIICADVHKFNTVDGRFEIMAYIEVTCNGDTIEIGDRKPIDGTRDADGWVDINTFQEIYSLLDEVVERAEKLELCTCGNFSRNERFDPNLSIRTYGNMCTPCMVSMLENEYNGNFVKSADKR